MLKLIVRKDIQPDGTAMITVYQLADDDLEDVGYAFMRNHDAPINNVAVDMYLCKRGGAYTMSDFVIYNV